MTRTGRGSVHLLKLRNPVVMQQPQVPLKAVAPAEWTEATTIADAALWQGGDVRELRERRHLPAAGVVIPREGV